MEELYRKVNELNYLLRHNNLEHGDHGSHNILIDGEGNLTVIDAKPNPKETYDENSAMELVEE